MTKDEIINKLLIEHDVVECGFSRDRLELLPKVELEIWLDNLEGERGHKKAAR